jgi:hypothetical protein
MLAPRSFVSRRILSILLLGVVGLGLLAACGGDDEPEDSSNPPGASTSTSGGSGSSSGSNSDSGSNTDANGKPDPCSLVTRQEAEAALGKPVAEGERPELAQGLICQFVGSQGTQVWQLQVLVTQTENETTMQSSFAAAKESVAETNPEDVSGIGDEAFWIPGAKQLNIREGRTYIIISGDAPLETLRGVAQKALSRL